MQQRQNNPLNRSRVPTRHPQLQPGPLVPATAADIADLRDAVTTLNIAVTQMQDTIAQLQALFTDLGDYPDDVAAAAGGVGIGDLYRHGSALMLRVA